MRGQNICATITEVMIFKILVIVCVSKDVIDKGRRPDGSIGLTPSRALHCGGGQTVCGVE